MTSSTRDRGGWLSAGRVGRPHGLDGSFYVVDPNPGLLELGMVVFVGASEVRIVRRAGTDARPIVRLEEVDDRAGAESLRSSELRVARSEAPSLGPDEWWAEDLVGCAVVDGERAVGTVARVVALPSCEVLEVARGGGPDLLVPLVSDAVSDVDVATRAINIDLRFLGEE